MTQVIAYTKTGNPAKQPLQLPEEVFAVTQPSTRLIHDAYRAAQANRRQANADAKTRSRVRGGGKKPWRQKGTGRARAGSIRSPLWRGGGIVFGPTDARNHRHRMPKHSKRAALRHALSLAHQHELVHVIEQLELDGSVRSFQSIASKLGLSSPLLVVVSELSPQIQRSTRNLPSVTVRSAKTLSVSDVVEVESLLLTKPALEALTQRLGGSR